MRIKLAGVVRESVVDGPGLRVVVFTQGCPHHCPGCHNAETHDPAGGYFANVADIFAEVAALARKNRIIRGVTFSGGEPFCQSRPLVALAIMIKGMGLNLIVYSGYTFEELCRLGQTQPKIKELLEYTDILIDGRYVEEERDLLLPYRGSRNQRLLDIKASLAAGQAVCWRN